MHGVGASVWAEPVLASWARTRDRVVARSARALKNFIVCIVVCGLRGIGGVEREGLGEAI